jgi:hypothetical protein
MSNQFQKSIHSEVAGYLLSLGFQSARDRWKIQIASEIVGSVGLNISSHRPDGYFGVSPLIGIEFEPLRLLLNSLMRTPKATRQMSLTTMLGYLMPEGKFLEWLLDSKQPVTQRNELRNMCKAIELYAIPFMHRLSTLAQIVDHLERFEFSFKERAVYHLPIAYRILKEDQKGNAYIEGHLQEISGRTGLAAEDYRRFASRFFEEAPQTDTQ